MQQLLIVYWDITFCWHGNNLHWPAVFLFYLLPNLLFSAVSTCIVVFLIKRISLEIPLNAPLNRLQGLVKNCRIHMRLFGNSLKNYSAFKLCLCIIHDIFRAAIRYSSRIFGILCISPLCCPSLKSLDVSGSC